VSILKLLLGIPEVFVLKNEIAIMMVTLDTSMLRFCSQWSADLG